MSVCSAPPGQALIPNRDHSGEKHHKEIAELAREGMLPVLRVHPGFMSYGVVETEDGKVVSVSLRDSAGQAQQANDLAASWVRENLADEVRLEAGYVGDFLFNENA